MRELLYTLGLSRRYRGYAYVMDALAIAMDNEDSLTAVVKDIYMVVAENTGSKWTAVERDIRTVVKRAWAVNRLRLEEISGYPLPAPPTTAEFLDILTAYVQRHGTKVQGRVSAGPR